MNVSPANSPVISLSMFCLDDCISFSCYCDFPAMFEKAVYLRGKCTVCACVCSTVFKANFNKHVIQTCALHSLFIHWGGVHSGSGHGHASQAVTPSPSADLSLMTHLLLLLLMTHPKLHFVPPCCTSWFRLVSMGFVTACLQSICNRISGIYIFKSGWFLYL